MPDETDEYGRPKLPDYIKSVGNAATVARALSKHFDQGVDHNRTLTMLADSIASVCEARQQDIEDESRYGARVTFVDDDGEAHTALVMEPSVATIGSEEAWDPHLEEYVNPQEAYPLGTVQLIYTPEFNLSDGFNFDRIENLEVATSVTPATEPDQTYCYYAGWDYALDTEE